MHFDRRFAVVVALSLGWALLVSGVFYRMLGGTRNGSSKPRKSVVLATEKLPVGATVQRTALKLGSVPEDLFPKGGFSRIEDVLDRPVIENIQPEEPVLSARLAERGAGVGLAPMIPSGMRAISLRVNDVVGVAGFILPGMHVDVLVTGRPAGHDDTVTRTVLQDITVLSAGQTIQADNKNPSINVTVVTLLVTPEQAEALVLANSEGRVQLVLRNSGDRKTAATGGKQLHDLYGVALHSSVTVAPDPLTEALSPKPRQFSRSKSVKHAAPLPLPPRPAPRQEMTIINGTVKTTVQFVPDEGASR